MPVEISRDPAFGAWFRVIVRGEQAPQSWVSGQLQIWRDERWQTCGMFQIQRQEWLAIAEQLAERGIPILTQ